VDRKSSRGITIEPTLCQPVAGGLGLAVGAGVVTGEAAGDAAGDPVGDGLGAA
jgi:hypothetical protein